MSFESRFILFLFRDFIFLIEIFHMQSFIKICQDFSKLQL